jgi:hypothetical protein
MSTAVMRTAICGCVVAVSALGLVACSGSDRAAQSAPVSPENASPPPASKRAVQHRVPILDQRRLRYVDVDGDGRRDRVVIRWHRLTRRSIGRGTATLTVHYADGHAASIRFRVGSWISRRSERVTVPPFDGTQIDGVRGREIVIATDDSPASFEFYTVVTARDHALSLLPAPDDHGWFVGAAAGPGASGFVCHGSTVTAVVSGPVHNRSREHSAINYRMIRTTYRWTLDSWSVVSRTITRGHPAGGQWRCPGIGAI